jgi:hypothetical protein
MLLKITLEDLRPCLFLKLQSRSMQSAVDNALLQANLKTMDDFCTVFQEYTLRLEGRPSAKVNVATTETSRLDSLEKNVNALVVAVKGKDGKPVASVSKKRPSAEGSKFTKDPKKSSLSKKTSESVPSKKNSDNSSAKISGNCFYCQKPGHKSYDCHKKGGHKEWYNQRSKCSNYMHIYSIHVYN